MRPRVRDHQHIKVTHFTTADISLTYKCNVKNKSWFRIEPSGTSQVNVEPDERNSDKSTSRCLSDNYENHSNLIALIHLNISI